MRPTILFYGNCQVRALWTIFIADRTVASAFNVAYIPNYDDLLSLGEVEPEVIASTAVLFEQFSPTCFPNEALLSSDCVRIVFPSLDLNLLWPLSSTNPFSDECSPTFPSGQFPYGDSVVVDCVM